MEPAAAAAAAAAAPPPSTAAAAASGAASGGSQGGLASLFVSELDSSVTEAVLFQHFASLGGRLVSVRVCRDNTTRRSLGYGYVNFYARDDAEQALNELNFVPLMGKPVRVMWSQRDPSKRRSGVGNIFIKGLHPEIDNRHLLDTFSDFGTIFSCKVVTDREGRSRGFGFVQFDDPKAAEAAIESVNGKEIMGQQVKVVPFKTKKQRLEEFAQAEREFVNVYVKNLPEDYTEDKLREQFAAFGTILSTKLINDESVSPPKFKGVAFVKYETSAAAHEAVEKMNGQIVEGKELYVGRAMRKQERVGMLRRQYEQRKTERNRSQAGNLYIKNLDEEVTDEKLREMFAKFGTITSAKVEKNVDGSSKGFGYVGFSTSEEATKAVTEMMGVIVPPNRKPLFVALHQSKEERRQRIEQLQQQQQAQMQQQAQQVAQQQIGMRMPMQPSMYGGAPVMYYGGGMPMPAQRPFFMPGMMPMAGQPGRMVMQPGMVAQPAPAAVGAMPAAAMPAGAYRVPTAGQNAPLLAAPPPQPRGPGAATNPAAAAAAVPPAAMAITPVNVQDLAAQLATLPPDAQRRLMGEQLYPRVQALEPAAGKVTGMLLEQNAAQILKALEDPATLQSQVAEAVKVLKQKGIYKSG